MPTAHQPQPYRSSRVIGSTIAVLAIGIIGFQTWLLTGMGTPTSGATISARIAARSGNRFLGSLATVSGDARMRTPAVLLGIRIEPRQSGALSLAPHETVRFTSVGIFSTMEQQITATWSLLRGATEQLIFGCQSSKTCTVTAGSGPENLTVFARSDGHEDHVNVTVRAASSTSPFSDTLPTWAASSILRLSDLGIIRGYEDGRYGPGDPLTRGQIAVLLTRVLEQSSLDVAPASCGSLLRTPSSHYAYRALCLFIDRGWEPDARIDPDAPVSRGETAAYINRVFGPAFLSALGTSQGSVLTRSQVFSDVPTDHWYFFDAGVMQIAQIMMGNPDGTFGVDRTLNRAEAATVLSRLLSAIEQHRITSL